MQQTIVDEVYKLNKEAGDVVIEWRWYPEVYETWKIRTAEPIYVRMQPLSGQFKDINNLFYCKLPYYGIDNGIIIRIKEKNLMTEDWKRISEGNIVNIDEIYNGQFVI